MNTQMNRNRIESREYKTPISNNVQNIRERVAKYFLDDITKPSFLSLSSIVVKHFDLYSFLFDDDNQIDDHRSFKKLQEDLWLNESGGSYWNKMENNLTSLKVITRQKGGKYRMTFTLTADRESLKFTKTDLTEKEMLKFYQSLKGLLSQLYFQTTRHGMLPLITLFKIKPGKDLNISGNIIENTFEKYFETGVNNENIYCCDVDTALYLGREMVLKGVERVSSFDTMFEGMQFVIVSAMEKINELLEDGADDEKLLAYIRTMEPIFNQMSKVLFIDNGLTPKEFEWSRGEVKDEKISRFIDSMETFKMKYLWGDFSISLSFSPYSLKRESPFIILDKFIYGEGEKDRHCSRYLSSIK